MTIWSLPELEGQVLPGMRVAGPFRRAETVASDGIVLSLERQEENTPSTEAGAVLSWTTLPVLDDKGIQLALWMRERYFCTVSATR